MNKSAFLILTALVLAGCSTTRDASVANSIPIRPFTANTVPQPTGANAQVSGSGEVLVKFTNSSRLYRMALPEVSGGSYLVSFDVTGPDTLVAGNMSIDIGDGKGQQVLERVGSVSNGKTKRVEAKLEAGPEGNRWLDVLIKSPGNGDLTFSNLRISPSH